MVSRMARFLKEAPRMLWAPIVVGIVALVLYILGTVPSYLQSPVGGAREYNSLEEAELELGFEIAVPAYFPSYLSWPPARIWGQLEPVPMVQMLFLASNQYAETLLITQIVSESEDLPVALPWIEVVRQEMPVTINGNEGRLIVGERADGRLVNGAYWRAGNFHFVVVTVQQVRELLTLVRSMHY